MNHFNLSAWAVNHPSLVLYLILISAGAGAIAYQELGRAEDPTFTIKTMVVVADWPGATSDEIEKQVADPIEEKLQETPYLDYLRTYSLPGKALVTVQLRQDTPPRSVADIWYQVRKKVGDIRHTLPQGVTGPYLDDEYGDVYAAVVAFTGEGYSPAELKKIAIEAHKRFLRLPDVSKVVMVGAQPEKVFVEFSHKKLATLGITPQQLFDSLTRQNVMVPSGSVETPTDRVYVRVEGTFSAVEQVKSVPIAANGRTFRIEDIAEVSRGYEDPATFTMRYNGQPAVGLSIAMSEGGNVLELGEHLDKELRSIAADLPRGSNVH